MAREFDVQAFYEALDRQRQERGLSWTSVAREIWDLSAVLNARRQDHPISPSTLTSMRVRGDTTCQHALFMLRWLGRSPESFLPDASSEEISGSLPHTGSDQRLRWNLAKLYEALDAERRKCKLTWQQLAQMLDCTPSQLSGIKKARFAIGMKLTMRIVLWLDRPSSDFIYLAKW